MKKNQFERTSIVAITFLALFLNGCSQGRTSPEPLLLSDSSKEIEVEETEDFLNSQTITVRFPEQSEKLAKPKETAESEETAKSQEADDKEDQQNTGGQAKQQENMEMKRDIRIADILIPGIPCLSETPFMAADVIHILESDPELKKVEGCDRGNGHFHYWKGAGIEYVTHSEGDPLAGVILTDSSYPLANGIHVGMKEEELIEKGYPFKRYESEPPSSGYGMVFGGHLLRDENNLLITTDYDYLYAYVGGASDDEICEYNICGTSCYSVVLLMRDGVVSKVILDLPTAG